MYRRGVSEGDDMMTAEKVARGSVDEGETLQLYVERRLREIRNGDDDRGRVIDEAELRRWARGEGQPSVRPSAGDGGEGL